MIRLSENNQAGMTASRSSSADHPRIRKRAMKGFMLIFVPALKQAYKSRFQRRMISVAEC